jgi:hypothetical protein
VTDRAIRIAALAAIALALGGAGHPDGDQGREQSVRSTDQPRPRDGTVAIQQELHAARRSGTVAAYDLFIARHPEHPLLEVARRERLALLRSASRPQN